MREAQLLDIAAEQIARAGYAGLSIGTVASQAGVSKPLVYAYFQTKDGLYIACVERAASILGEAIAAGAVGDGLQRAKETLRCLFTALEPRPIDWNVLFDRSHPAEGPAADAARNARRRIAEQTREGVAAAFAGNPVADDPIQLAAMADIWMGAVSALVNRWLRHPELDAELMVERSLALMDNLVRAAAGQHRS
ncbi:TetR/AcrR family transcriptional regulator [Hoyosella sp. YIM 151337]|uniref:TetR/AcrR family transcriptional regulator n=1 Tax=Hoyosella sp. YIM 151337 TaxID=2992742 RepID=UPI0022354368|nr:TetR/AcrR family transcriptional regulator [Hoyosella sp. YIM 151337]MCW4355192.1 TetR/AcrR family transcriptional regulator [Hoyosella sp. YIM 151337]